MSRPNPIRSCILWLVARVVPSGVRERWLEEWRAELRHAGPRMIFGALPDALALRRIARERSRPRTARRSPPWHALSQDVRHALRGLARGRGFAAGVVLSLAAGIGANTAAFSFLNAAVFRPYPHIHDQEGLVRLSVVEAQRGSLTINRSTYSDFRILAEQLTTVGSLAANVEVTLALSSNGTAAAVPGMLASANYFDVLGVRPVAGRTFVPAEDRPGHATVIISDHLWARMFERSAAALGASVVINGTTAQIVGVMPPDFMGIQRSNRKPDVWLPLGLSHLALRRDGRPARIEDAVGYRLDMVGRRRADARHGDVSAEAAGLAHAVAATRARQQVTVTATSAWLNKPEEVRAAMIAFMAVPMLVLAIACVNAANLLLARSHGRSREFAVRVAVGASRWRVVRQVLCEGVILAIPSALAGLVLTRWSLALLASEVPFPMPLDHRVLAFTVVLAVVTAIAFSLWPALQVTAAAARPASFNVAASPVAPSSRTRFAFVFVQAALSLGLLATGAQFAKTLYATVRFDTIAHPDTLLLASFDVDPVAMDQITADDFYARLLHRVRQLPGVRGAALALRGFPATVVAPQMLARVTLPDDAPGAERTALAVAITAGFFEVVGVPPVLGRALRETDGTTAVVVNESFARFVLGGQPIGRTFRLGSTDGRREQDVTVVGVVPGIAIRSEREPPITYHLPSADTGSARTLSLRLDGSGTFNVAALHTAVQEVHAHVPMTDVALLADLRSTNPERRFLTRSVVALGATALVLAALGLHSVISFIISLRRRELGVRLALGAAPGSIVRMVMRQGLVPTVSGAALGAAGAAVAGELIESRLYGAAGPDPLAFGFAASLMLLVMAVAVWIPASRAGRVDPLEVLRTQ